MSVSKVGMLRARRDGALKAAQEIIDTAKNEGRKVTRAENEKFEALMAESRRHDGDVAGEEKIDVANYRRDRVVTRHIEPEPIALPPGVTGRIEVPRYAPSQLRAFPRSTEGREAAHRAGMWALAVIYGSDPAREWCDGHGVERRVMVEGVNTKGGFLVPDELDTAIIDIKESYGMIRQNARVRRMTSDTRTIPRRVGGVTAYFVGETDATTESDKSWDAVTLTAKEVAAMTRVSSSFSEDAAIDVAEDLATEMGWAFAKKEDECGIDGDGTSTYGGMVGFRTKMVDGNHAASYEDATAGDDQFTELLLADVVSLIGKLPQYAHARAQWFCSQYCWGATFLRLLAAVGGNSLAEIVAGARRPIFMGYPVILSPAMPSATTAYDELIMLAFGDLGMAVTLGDRRQTTVQILRERFAEFRQIAIQCHQRFDIVAHDLGDASTAGPLVGLRGNSA